MAVDVPESFIARNKTPPRYPPPRVPNQVNQFLTGAMPQVAVSLKTFPFIQDAGSGDGVGGDTGGISLELQPFESFDQYQNNNKTKSQVHHHHYQPSHTNNHHHQHKELYHKNSSSLESSKDIMKKTSSPSKSPSLLGSTCESIGFDSMSYRTKSRDSDCTSRSSSSDGLGPPEYDLGPHRELPVDVPLNFIEIRKGPPRYPPPRSHLYKETGKVLLSKPIAVTTELSPSEIGCKNNSAQQQPPVRNNEVFYFI